MVLGRPYAQRSRGHGHQETAYQMAQTKGDEIAAILFTSGSTGPPKGVVYRHENFAAQVEMIRELFGIQPGEIDLTNFPAFCSL